MEEEYEGESLDDFVIKDKEFRKNKRIKRIKLLFIILAVLVVITAIILVIIYVLNINYGKIKKN